MHRNTFLHYRKNDGFTLIEMIVSIGVFTIVMTLSVGAILITNDALRKARLYKNAMENATVTMEFISKRIRVATNYHCGSTGVLTLPQNCPYVNVSSVGGTHVAFFERKLGVDYTTEYRLNATEKTIEMRQNAGSWKVVTSPDLEITYLKFYVENAGSTSAQARVTILLNGRAVLPGKTTLNTEFHLQTTVSQRIVNK